MAPAWVTAITRAPGPAAATMSRTAASIRATTSSTGSTKGMYPGTGSVEELSSQ